MADIIEELARKVIEAENEALKREIETNAIILNRNFDYVKSLNILLGGRVKCSPPMICGKYIFTSDKLPEKYSFILTQVPEEMYETELDKYKKKCEELERKLDYIKEMLG